MHVLPGFLVGISLLEIDNSRHGQSKDLAVSVERCEVVNESDFSNRR
jgi:hypothetical protein